MDLTEIDRSLISSHSKCETCKDTGYINRTDDEGYVYGAECKCLKAKRARRRIEKSGLAHMLDRCTFDAFETHEPWQAEIKRCAETCVNEPSWFYIGGEVGCGKTHICTAIVGELLNRGRSARYMLWRDESVVLKAVVGDDQAYYESVSPLKTVDVLYIDDFLKTRTVTQGDVNLAFEIINYRYNNPDLITVISSEHTLDEIMEIDMAVGSRIYQRAGRYKLTISRDAKKNYRLR
jgi:DNA replication protein DnaC